MATTPESPAIMATRPESPAIMDVTQESPAIMDATPEIAAVINIALEATKVVPRHLRLASSLVDTPLMSVQQLASLWWYQVWGLRGSPSINCTPC